MHELPMNIHRGFFPSQFLQIRAQFIARLNSSLATVSEREDALEPSIIVAFLSYHAPRI